jgi:hypothetical protein
MHAVGKTETSQSPQSIKITSVWLSDTAAKKKKKHQEVMRKTKSIFDCRERETRETTPYASTRSSFLSPVQKQAKGAWCRM